MKIQKYKNQQIKYSIPDDKNYFGKISVEIEHKHVHVMKLIDGSYATHFLPYLHYDSIEELIYNVIDNVPFFRH